MPDIAWTDDQRAAISAEDGSVLVSAGAGSGKTAVLSERCVHLVMDAKSPCDVDELLVVTFTEASAAEMRERIGRRLRARVATSPTARAKRQLALLGSAQISTIHAFCRRVLNRHFAQAGLDPETPLLDPHDAYLLRQETAALVFESARHDPTEWGQAFRETVAAYGSGEDRGLQALALNLEEFLSSLSDPEQWVKHVLAEFETKTADALSDAWLQRLCNTLQEEFRSQIATLEQLIQSLSAPVLESTRAAAVAYSDQLTAWLTQLERDPSPASVDRVCSEDIPAYAFPKLPRKSKAITALGPELEQRFMNGNERVREIKRRLFDRGLQRIFGKFTTGQWAEGIARTRDHVSTLLTLVEQVNNAYQDAKRGLGVLDFNDLERKAADLLSDEENGIAEQLRREYAHVLVDEFQDINPLQARILELVSRESDPTQTDNFFAVGDVKQSIYRFRLAEPLLFLSRQKQFRDETRRGQAIDLRTNFRSRPRLIEAINAIFERLMAADLGGIDYDQRARLEPGREAAAEPEGPVLELHLIEETDKEEQEDSSARVGAYEWEQIEREAFVIGRRILKLRGEGWSFGDMVILLRSMKPRTGLLVRTLLRMGVPVYSHASGGFFESLEVMDILSLLSLLDNEQQDIALASVLRSPLFGAPLTDSDLVEITVAARGDGPRLKFHHAVSRYAREGRQDDLRARIVGILQRIRTWRDAVRHRPVAEILWRIYDETGYLAYVSGLREGGQRRANLVQLHTFARRFSSFRREGLHAFLTFLDEVRESKEDLESGSVVAPAGEVVRIMTIHASKGLEFPIVFVGELGKRFNLEDSRGNILFDRQLGIGIKAVDVERRIVYPTLPQRLVSRAVRAEALAEEMRVMYVAFTRAEDRLILVGTAKPLDPEKVAPRSGPIPLTGRIAAGEMIDWVTTAIGALDEDEVAWLREQRDVSQRIVVRSYGQDEMNGWTIDPPPTRKTTETLERVSRMLPVGDVTPAGDAIVEVVSRRMSTRYAAESLTHVPAVAAASTLKRRWNVVQDGDEPLVTWLGGTGQTTFSRHFRKPEFMRADQGPDPTQRGTWTHAFLQHLELSRAASRAELEQQLGEMVEAGTLQTAEAGAIDLDSVAWFFDTEVGRRLRDPATQVRREWPFVIGVDPSRYDPAASAIDRSDTMLVRGIIDCLFDSGDGWELLDYKTDRVEGPEVQTRADEYAGQLQIYATAVAASWGLRPKRNWLAFLGPREMVETP